MRTVLSNAEELPNNSVRVNWRILNLFLIVFPFSEAVRLHIPYLPAGVMNLALLISLVLFLLYMEVVNMRKYGGVRSCLLTIRKTEWILLLFTVLSILATIHSVNIHTSLFGLPGEYGGLVPIVCYTVLFAWTAHRVSPSQHVQLTQTMTLASIIPTAYGILQHMANIPGIQYVSRSFSLFCNADFFGTYLTLMMILTLVLYIRTSGFRSLAYLILLVFQFIAIVFSSTRSGWLGGAVGGAVLLSVAVFDRLLLWKKTLLAIGILVLSFVLLNLSSHNQLVSRASSIAANARQIVTNDNPNLAGSSRWYIWKESIPLVVQHPILGVGPDTFESAFRPPKTSAQNYLYGQPIANANNAYIQVGVTLGIPALVSLLAFYGVVLTKGLLSQRRKYDNSKSVDLFTVGLLSAMVGYLIQGFFNMDVVPVAPMFWVVIAMTYRRSLIL